MEHPEELTKVAAVQKKVCHLPVLVMLHTCCVWPDTPYTAVYSLRGMGYLPVMHLGQMLPCVAYGKTAALQCCLQHALSCMQSQVILGGAAAIELHFS